MALTTREIQTQKSLMEQEIEKMAQELEAKRNEYHEAFGQPTIEKPGKFKAIMIAIILGLAGGIGLIIAVGHYFPNLSK